MSTECKDKILYLKTNVRDKANNNNESENHQEVITKINNMYFNKTQLVGLKK